MINAGPQIHSIQKQSSRALKLINYMLCIYFLTSPPVRTILLLPLQTNFYSFLSNTTICITHFRGWPKDDDGIPEMQCTCSILGGVTDRQRQTELIQNQCFGGKKTVKYINKFSFEEASFVHVLRYIRCTNSRAGGQEGCRPPERQSITTTGHHNTCCNLQSYAPDDGQMFVRNMLS
jgi:hypothetical protein